MKTVIRETWVSYVAGMVEMYGYFKGFRLLVRWATYPICLVIVHVAVPILIVGLLLAWQLAEAMDKLWHYTRPILLWLIMKRR